MGGKDLLTKLFSGSAKNAPSPGYEEQKRILEGPDEIAREALARNPNVRPEVLYYLAEDSSSAVRQGVAANPATPAPADLLLARDEDDDVRADLALKISRLVPDLDRPDVVRLRDKTLEVLELLAQDQLPRVRAIIAEELKASEKLPRRLAKQLAMDIETIVCAPILEYSPMLRDADLVEVIAATRAEGAVSAVARRQDLSTQVTDAVVATLDVAAVATLLTNDSAQLREETLDQIIDQATQIDAWHEPLVLRSELSVRAVRRIAGFVATSLLEGLTLRTDLDPALTDELNERVRHRLEHSTGSLQEEDRERAIRMIDGGLLDDAALVQEIEQGHRDFVVQALSLKSGIAVDDCARILRSHQAKAITSLAWRAGFMMRTATMLQTHLGHLRPADLLYARDGTEFPLSESEMLSYLPKPLGV